MLSSTTTYAHIVVYYMHRSLFGHKSIFVYSPLCAAFTALGSNFALMMAMMYITEEVYCAEESALFICRSLPTNLLARRNRINAGIRLLPTTYYYYYYDVISHTVTEMISPFVGTHTHPDTPHN